jgi:heme-degrading monooxygenase HmoA
MYSSCMPPGVAVVELLGPGAPRLRRSGLLRRADILVTLLELSWSSRCWVRLPEGQPPATGWVNWAYLNRLREASCSARSKASARPSPDRRKYRAPLLNPAGTAHNDGVMVRVWEYDVPETSRAEFERTYGAAGDWVRLFSRSDGFRGTELFVSLSDPGRYLTVDRFTDEGAWRSFLIEHRNTYARLDAATKD